MTEEDDGEPGIREPGIRQAGPRDYSAGTRAGLVLPSQGTCYFPD